MYSCVIPHTRALACLLFLAISGAVLADEVRADQPLTRPEAVVCSASGRYCLHGPPLQPNLSMFRMEQGQASPLWTAPGAAARYMVAEDGEHYVLTPPGQDMLTQAPGQADPGRVMFVFYARERELARVTLGQLIRNVPQLPRTVSHLRWARSFGFAPDGKFVIRTEENREFTFDPATGARLGERAISP